MKHTAITKKLARALMDVAKQGEEARAFGEDLQRTAAVFRENYELAGALLNPMNRLEERLALMKDVARALEVSPAVEKFLGILVETRHIGLIDEIEAAYARLDDERTGRLRATIEAPQELSEGLLAEIKAKLSEITGKVVVLKFTQDPSLIGGLVIKMDNTVIDGSIRTQLEILKTRMMAEA